jgi:hypothetical protein
VPYAARGSRRCPLNPFGSVDRRHDSVTIDDDKELRQTENGVVPTMVPSPPEAGLDPGLARLNVAWATLPAHIKAAILALLDAADPAAQRGIMNV